MTAVPFFLQNELVISDAASPDVVWLTSQDRRALHTSSLTFPSSYTHKHPPKHAPEKKVRVKKGRLKQQNQIQWR